MAQVEAMGMDSTCLRASLAKILTQTPCLHKVSTLFEPVDGFRCLDEEGLTWGWKGEVWKVMARDFPDPMHVSRTPFV
jgi:hypothetical protein